MLFSKGKRVVKNDEYCSAVIRKTEIMVKKGRLIYKKGKIFGSFRKWTWKCGICGKEYLARVDAVICEIMHNPKSERAKRLYRWQYSLIHGYGYGPRSTNPQPLNSKSKSKH